MTDLFSYCTPEDMSNPPNSKRSATRMVIPADSLLPCEIHGLVEHRLLDKPGFIPMMYCTRCEGLEPRHHREVIDVHPDEDVR